MILRLEKATRECVADWVQLGDALFSTSCGCQAWLEVEFDLGILLLRTFSLAFFGVDEDRKLLSYTDQTPVVFRILILR